MTVARISIMLTSSDLTRTAAAKRADVERLLDELEEHLSNLPGYIMGFRFAGHENENEVGRVALWNSHEDADHAATQDHTIALRARIHQLIDPGHLETLVEVKGTPRIYLGLAATRNNAAAPTVWEGATISKRSFEMASRPPGHRVTHPAHATAWCQ
jgi:heme-degrading monooxygenase HmoA